MLAMVLEQIGKPLILKEWPDPVFGPEQVLIDVEGCGVCRTDLHIIDGELVPPNLPVILGHQIVGRVAAVGTHVNSLTVGMRVGVPWLGWTCGSCHFCREGLENLCPQARFTGFSLLGGFAEKTVAYAEFCYPLPTERPAEELAPLLCAGLIGYRTLAKAGYARRIGIYGFGAAAHLVLQVAIYQGRQVYVFTRKGDKRKQQLAVSLGAHWAGDCDELPPELLDAALIFAPVGELVPLALRATRPGGAVICGGIHMSDIPSFPYRYLWEERRIESVANLTRGDGEIFLRLATRIPVRPIVKTYPLEKANDALDDLRAGRVEGAAVLKLR